MEEKSRAHAAEVNRLLMEKIELQGEGIGRRERELQREREYGCVARPHVSLLLAIIRNVAD